jgi:proteasome activator subunit 4
VIGFNTLTEPCFLVFDAPTPSLNEAITKLRLSLNVDAKEDPLILQCREQRVKRFQNMNEVIENSVS